jgi:hypothetical protein
MLIGLFNRIGFTMRGKKGEKAPEHSISVGITDVKADFKKIEYINGYQENHNVTAAITDVTVAFLEV